MRQGQPVPALRPKHCFDILALFLVASTNIPRGKIGRSLSKERPRSVSSVDFRGPRSWPAVFANVRLVAPHMAFDDYATLTSGWDDASSAFHGPSTSS